MAQKFEEVRIPKNVSVTVRGVDRNGHQFTQTASTLDISRHGARLDGLGCVANAQTIEVSCGWFNKAQFKVVWAGQPGTPEAAQVGIRAVDKGTNLWGLEFPPARPCRFESKPNEAAASVDSGPISVGLENSTYGDKPPELAFEIPPDVQHFADAPPVAARPGMSAARAKTIHVNPTQVSVRWTSGGMRHEAAASNAKMLGDSSCMLQLKAHVLEGTDVELITGPRREVRKGRVVMTGPPDAAGLYSVAVDLD